MKHDNHSPTLWRRWLRPLLIGLCVGVIGCTLVLLLMALVVGSVDIPRQLVMPMAITAAAVGAFLAGLVASRLSGKNGLLLGLACGLLLFLIILVAGFVRYTGADAGTSAIKLAVLLIAGGVGGVLGVGKRSR